jgi:hypothetical protein
MNGQGYRPKVVRERDRLLGFELVEFESVYDCPGE